MKVRVQVLGPLRAWYDGEELALGSPQQRVVLGLLAAGAGRVISADVMAETLWGPTRPAAAENTIQSYIARLRRLLEPDREPRQQGTLIRTVNEGYSLRLERLEVDVVVFRARVNAARHAFATGDATAAFRDGQVALSMWAGGALEDLPSLAPWVSGWERERGAAADLLGGAAIAAGRASDALPTIAELAELYPLDEQLHARVIELYAATGRRSDAFVAFHRARRRLVDHTGLDSARLNAAYSALLAEPTTPSGTGQRRDRPTPAQLPAAIDDFVGRHEEVEKIADLLTSDPDAGRMTPLAAVTGMGGIGKSALAVHVAHRVVGEYPDGQLYVDLGGGTADPAEVGQVLAGFLLAFGLEGSEIPESVDARAALYRSYIANRRVLVVLDNATDEAQVQPLLPGTPSSAVLITSRSSFARLCGRSAVELHVMDEANAMELLSQVIGRGRVAAEQEAAARIIELCDQIPLALRLAAARLTARPGWTLGQFADSLRDERRRLSQLDTQHNGIRAAFTVSYEGLTPAVGTAFRCLGLLPLTGIASWVMAALMDCPVAEAEDMLDALADARLIAPAPNDGGEDTWWMHDLVRLYARERAMSEDSDAERDAAATRAIGAWLTLAEQADQQMMREYDAVRSDVARWSVGATEASRILVDPIGWFEAERVNLAMIIPWACERGSGDQAWNLADACAGFYETRGLLTDYQATHTRCLAACGHDPLGRAVMLRNLAELTLSGDSEPKVKRQYVQQAVEAADQVGSPVLAVDARILMAMMHEAEADSATAVGLLTEALEIARTHGHLTGQTSAHSVLGEVYLDQGRFEDAAEHLVRSIELSAGGQLSGARLSSFRFLGTLRLRQGRAAEGIAALHQGIAEADGSGTTTELMVMLALLGEALVDAGDPEGVDHLLRAQVLGQKMGSYGQIVAERGLALAELRRGDPEMAKRRLAVALPLMRAESAPRLVVATLRVLAEAEVALGDVHAALAALAEASDIYARLGNDEDAAAMAIWMEQIQRDDLERLTP